MKVLILGNGQVANAVAATALESTAVASSAPAGSPRGVEVIACARAALDIIDAAAALRTFTELKPDWVVNAAAYTAVDLAEDNQAQAFAVNDTAVAGLASAAAKVGCRLLHLSTDFVFDGASSRAYLPGDATNPLSVYGASKLAGERHVIAAAGAGATAGGARAGIVLRTSWVYAATGKNFVLTMLRLMREKPRLAVVCDQIGAPTWATSVGRAVWGLINAQAAPGIYHWTDLGVASWYDFAVAIQDEALARGLLTRLVPVAPITSREYPARAKRPAFSLLDTTATRAAIKVPADHWRHNLRKMLDELRAE